MQKIYKYLRIVSYGMIICFVFLVCICFNKTVSKFELIFQETLPFFYCDSLKNIFVQENSQEVFSQKNILQDDLVNNLEIENHDLLEENNIEYEIKCEPELISEIDMNKLDDINYLKAKIYNLDKKTDMCKNDFDINKFLATDLKIKNKNGIKIIIFHTHSSEIYSDSNNILEGVIGVGKELTKILNEKYKIKTLHHTKRYDIINKIPDKRGAYERMESDMLELIKKYPTVEILLDIHRDGVENSIRLVENINNKPTAKIMFVNGLCKILNKDGVLCEINNLENKFIEKNLAFSFNMQINAANLYPGLTRKIYLNAYRYSLNMMPKSLLIEVGAQTNTKQEAINSVEPLAEILASVIL